jgi:hypothetical protein
VIDTVKPICINIGNTAWMIQVKSYLDDWPYRFGKTKLEEYMFYCLVLMIEDTSSTPMAIPFCEVVFGENYFSTEMPSKKNYI